MFRVESLVEAILSKRPAEANEILSEVMHDILRSKLTEFRKIVAARRYGLYETAAEEGNEGYKNPGKRDPRLYQIAQFGEVKVWVVDGEIVRNDWFQDFTEGGNDAVYKEWLHNEIWIDDRNEDEIVYILIHELHENYMMKKYGWTYDKAHGSANIVENKARHSKDDDVVADILDDQVQLCMELQQKDKLKESINTGNVRRIGRLKVIRVRIRNGKIQRRKKLSAVKGYTFRGGRLKRMSTTERRHRKLGARRAKIKRRSKRARSRLKLMRSLRKRKSLGLRV